MNPSPKTIEIYRVCAAYNVNYQFNKSKSPGTNRFEAYRLIRIAKQHLNRLNRVNLSLRHHLDINHSST